MWELFFELPLYPNMNVYEVTSKVINDSLRPEIPKVQKKNLKLKNLKENKIPKEIKELMKNCWKTEPTDRPEWVHIIKTLKNVIEKKFGEKSFYNYPKIEI